MKIFGRIKHIVSIFITLMYNLARLALSSLSVRKKRILGIWDYKALPWSIGDPLVFVEKLSLLKVINNADEIDICVVYDMENPAGKRGVSYITEENVGDNMLDTYLPLFGTSPYLGSIFQFRSRDEFYQFLNTSGNRYIIFPPLAKHLSEIYNYHGGEPRHFTEVEEFHAKYGYIPYLKIGRKYLDWARAFYLGKLQKNEVPVTFSLRIKSSAYGGDSKWYPDTNIWLEFFDNCKREYPEVKFIFLGYREEEFSGLREKSNIIISKDFGTSIMEDFALLRLSSLYMGTTSGINTIAQFSDQPYIVFQFSDKRYGLKEGKSFRFASDMQKIFSTEVKMTPEFLLDEFRNLYSGVDKQKWQKELNENNISKS